MPSRTDVTATTEIVKHSSDNQTYALDFTTPLYGRTLSSVTSISAESGLTVADEVVNSSSYTDDRRGVTVAANKAVQFTASGGTALNDYAVTIVCATSDSKTLSGVVVFKVRDE